MKLTLLVSVILHECPVYVLASFSFYIRVIISLLFRLTAKKMALAMVAWTGLALVWKGQDLAWVDPATVWAPAMAWVGQVMVAWMALDLAETTG